MSEEKKVKSEKFISLKFSELRVVLDPKIKKEVQGSLIGSSVYGKFENGLVVEFKNGEYDATDELVIEELKKHPYYGAMFVSASEKGAVKPSDEALRSNNERKTTAEDLASTCPECGKKCKNKQGLEIHMRSHQK